MTGHSTHKLKAAANVRIGPVQDRASPNPNTDRRAHEAVGRLGEAGSAFFRDLALRG